MIEEWVWNNRKRTGQRVRKVCPVQIIVYADDFVVIAKEKWIVTELKDVIEEWCQEKMWVELSIEKTRITNIFEGFDFLSCNIRKYKTNNTTSKTLVKPSKESIKSVKLKIKEKIKCSGGKTQSQLIGILNPIIRGWANYHNAIVSKKIFSNIDNYIIETLMNWANKRHSNKGKIWITKKYWHTVGNRNWVFKTDECTLIKMSDTKIIRHVKVKGRHHAYDGDAEYWLKRRMTNTKSEKTRKETCLVKQKLKCNWCQQTFKPDSIMELDHIIPKCCGGNEQKSNLQVLHRHCHDTKTKNDGTYNKKMHKPKVYSTRSQTKLI